MADGGDDAIYAGFNGIVESVDLANTEARKAAELEVDRGFREHRVLGLDAGANVIEERCDLFRKIHRDTQLALGGENAGSEIGAIAHGLGHLLNAFFGDRVDARAVVQGAVDGADGHFQHFGNIDQPDHAWPF